MFPLFSGQEFKGLCKSKSSFGWKKRVKQISRIKSPLKWACKIYLCGSIAIVFYVQVDSSEASDFSQSLSSPYIMFYAQKKEWYYQICLLGVFFCFFFPLFV